MPSAVQSLGMTFGAPLFCAPGPRWSGGEVRALAVTATSREEINDAELHQQLTPDAPLRILHPSMAGKPIRHP